MNTELKTLHKKPVYNNFDGFGGYIGGFVSVTKCYHCGTVGLYEDCHPADPCFNCGEQVEDGLSGKWIPPITKSKWFGLVVTTIETGYWIGKDG